MIILFEVHFNFKDVMLCEGLEIPSQNAISKLPFAIFFSFLSIDKFISNSSHGSYQNAVNILNNKKKSKKAQ